MCPPNKQFNCVFLLVWWRAVTDAGFLVTQRGLDSEDLGFLRFLFKLPGTIQGGELMVRISRENSPSVRTSRDLGPQPSDTTPSSYLDTGYHLLWCLQSLQRTEASIESSLPTGDGNKGQRTALFSGLPAGGQANGEPT